MGGGLKEREKSDDLCDAKKSGICPLRPEVDVCLFTPTTDRLAVKSLLFFLKWLEFETWYCLILNHCQVLSPLSTEHDDCLLKDLLLHVVILSYGNTPLGQAYSPIPT